MQGHCNENDCFSYVLIRKFALNSKILLQTDSNSPSMGKDNFQKNHQIRQSQGHIIVLYKPKKHAVPSQRLNKIMDLNHKKITSIQYVNFFAFQILSYAKHEKKIKMYIFKTCSAICENFVRAHFLKASFHHHYSKLQRFNYIFLKLESQAFHLIQVSLHHSLSFLIKN